MGIVLNDVPCSSSSGDITVTSGDSDDSSFRSYGVGQGLYTQEEFVPPVCQLEGSVPDVRGGESEFHRDSECASKESLYRFVKPVAMSPACSIKKINRELMGKQNTPDTTRKPGSVSKVKNPYLAAQQRTKERKFREKQTQQRKVRNPYKQSLIGRDRRRESQGLVAPPNMNRTSFGNFHLQDSCNVSSSSTFNSFGQCKVNFSSNTTLQVGHTAGACSNENNASISNAGMLYINLLYIYIENSNIFLFLDNYYSGNNPGVSVRQERKCDRHGKDGYSNGNSEKGISHDGIPNRSQNKFGYARYESPTDSRRNTCKCL